MSTANLLVMVTQRSEALGALVAAQEQKDAEARRQEQERAARAAARAEQREAPAPPMLLARSTRRSVADAGGDNSADLTVLQRQNRLLREAIRAKAEERDRAQRELASNGRRLERRLRAPSPPPPARARSAPRIPAAGYTYELRQLKAEFAAAQQDKLQLQVMAASLQQAVEMREKEQAARARQQAGATSTTRPVTADGQRRRRRRPV